MSPKIITVLIGSVVLIGGGIFLYYEKVITEVKPLKTVQTSDNPAPSDEIPMSVVIIATSSGTLRSYTSKEYGFHFQFPGMGWYVGDNHLGYGTFQLSSNDPTTADGKDFVSGSVNKIEMAIVQNNANATSTDYPEVSRSEKMVVVAGQKSKVFDIELQQGNIRSYYIPLPQKPSLFLVMSIYGNVSNFHLLDEIAKSFIFEKAFSPSI